MGRMASDVAALKHRSFAACTPEELAALRRIMARIRLTPPRRRTRRIAAGSGGPGAGSAQDDQGVDAHARRSCADVLAAAPGQAAAVDPDS